jgi:hypothetical protein
MRYSIDFIEASYPIYKGSGPTLGLVLAWSTDGYPERGWAWGRGKRGRRADDLI